MTHFPRKPDDFSHFCSLPNAAVRFGNATTGDGFVSRGEFLSSSLMVSSFVALRFGGVRWLHYRGGRALRPAKLSVRHGGRPTHLSETCFQKFRNALFGLKTPRQTSPHSVAAVSEWPNAILADIANGRATRSPPSSPKFSAATPCAMSALPLENRSAA